MTAFCAAVDWGTTSLRLWVLARDGAILGESRGTDGILSVAEGGYPDVLERHLTAAGAGAGLPVVICGMAGARQGWVEAPYADTPADIEGIAGAALAVTGQGRDIRILPGVAQRDPERPDVMRGEETQLFGLDATDLTVCMPGTHSKWVTVSHGRITDFTTFMTGELFAVLSTQSILKHSTTETDFDPMDEAFRQGVEIALAAGASLSASLFGVRARELVAEGSGNGAAYLSGLLIGSELAAAGRAKVDILLMASGRTAGLYGQAMQLAGLDFRLQDAEGAARRGLLRAAEAIWG